MTKKKGTNKKHNWLKVKNEYLTTQISLRKLAEKHNIPFATLNSRSNKEKWGKEKKDFQNKIITKTEQKTVEKISDKLSSQTIDYLSINNLAGEAIKEFFNNGDYKKSLVKTKKPYLDADGKPVFSPKGIPVMIETVEIVDIPYVDTAALRNAIEGLKTSNITDRLNRDIISEIEKQKLSIEREKLELDKQKLQTSDDDLSDDNFIEALTGQIDETWADYEPAE